MHDSDSAYFDLPLATLAELAARILYFFGLSYEGEATEQDVH